MIYPLTGRSGPVTMMTAVAGCRQGRTPPSILAEIRSLLAAARSFRVWYPELMRVYLFRYCEMEG